ncbi:hypothetical protein Tco_0227981 [Tanacetum coccineum]
MVVLDVMKMVRVACRGDGGCGGFGSGGGGCGGDVAAGGKYGVNEIFSTTIYDGYMQLAESLGKDEPKLGIKFDGLTTGAFGMPIELPLDELGGSCQFLKKNKRNPAECRPDISHQVSDRESIILGLL